ncbi:hypothetical protein I552_0114, partial [Mycobacterium xenopi 3993]
MFITPFHPTGNPHGGTRIRHGARRRTRPSRFDEAWFGEHHSGGYELIAARGVHRGGAERTKH